MATLYTDEVRNARYDLCRRQAKRCEKVFDGAMWAMLFVAVTEVLPQLARGFLYGVFIGELEPFFAMLIVAAIMAFALYSIFRRDWRFLLAATFVSCAAGYPFFILFGFLTPLVLLAALIVSFRWRRLEQEEGFPEFLVTYAEHSSQETKQVSRAYRRAVEEGTRGAQSTLNAHADMSDLLDEGVEQLPAGLTNYHERSRNAEAVGQLRQPPHSGDMDEL